MTVLLKLYKYFHMNIEAHDMRKSKYDSVVPRPFKSLCGKKIFNAEEFKNIAKTIHGDYYDYSHVKDTDKNISRLKIEIICPIHGTYHQGWCAHLDGSKCPKCAQQQVFKKLKKTLNVTEFIYEAKKIHRDEYDYSKVVSECYINGRPMIMITCKKHGDFIVNALDHIGHRGGRCKNCTKKESYGEYLIRKELEKRNIKFVQEKIFFDLMNDTTKHYYRFDFFLEDYNLIIEFDGEIHFIENSWHKRQKSLYDVKNVDVKKEIYLKDKNIELVRISYLNRNPVAISNIMDDILNQF